MATSAVSSAVADGESARKRFVAAALRPGAGSAIAQKARAVPLQPLTLLRCAGGQLLDEAPEADAVIHLGEMRHLMCDDIVEHRLGREDEAPREGEIAGRRAAAPAAPGVADA